MRPLQVRAFWDAETGVWVAESADVPGLVTEAPGLDSLKAKLGVLIPELLAAIGRLPVETSVIRHATSRVPRAVDPARRVGYRLRPGLQARPGRLRRPRVLSPLLLFAALYRR